MQNLSLINRIIVPAIKGTSEVFFPPNDKGMPDWQQTDMVERTLQYIEELPPKNAALIRLLFFAFEYLVFILMPSLLPFSRNRPARRLAMLYRLKSSRFFFIRILPDGLKATLSMIYFSHPEVMKACGEYKAMRNDADPFKVPIKKPPAAVLSARPKTKKSASAKKEKVNKKSTASKKKKPAVKTAGKTRPAAVKKKTGGRK